ncbi:MAG: UDP-glucose 4-epimerase [Candidatus Berkelbacteria bacterium Licking1014_85]|uniref:UDP-glucose 4-epimerase n=1 Tax=Candidatus Berkelbacteria bacterium Licking1014_85 TaxID=2017148 RepID=A0A554LJ65_9BACT|nr:MAG: UDP-glucose 4-epimerase [Candidatus Berkelbacteria bacterium Licking1014_85]
MKYLITGGAGFIGSHIVEELVRRRQNVIVLDNLSTGYLRNLDSVKDKITFIKGDITKKPDVIKAMKGVDFVCHLAASLSVIESVAKPEKYIKNNVLGTLNLLKIAHKNKVKKFVLSSTCATYGTASVFPTPENYVGVKLSPYAYTKYSAEEICRYYSAVFNLPTVVLRYFNVYGPRQDASSSYAGVIPIFSKLMSQGKQPKIFGNGKQTRDFVGVKDVALANINACLSDIQNGEAINIGSSIETSVNELYSKISKLLNFQIPAIYQPARAGEAQRALGNISKMRKILKIIPKTLDDELESTVRWYQSA